MKNKKIKLALNLILIVLLFLSQTGIVQAINVGNVNKIMGVKTPPDFLNSIFEDLGVDKNELKSNIQTFNVSSSKKTPPQVSLFFSPANPSEGEKITVTASPTYFMNDPKDLYYTWFLKSNNCYDEKSDGSDYKNKFKDGDFDKCDLNNDNDVDIEDYKIKATRIIANGGFIISSDDVYNAPTGDNDGYKASSGGNDQLGKDGHCYIHNTKSGDEYEIDCGSGKDSHLFPHAEFESDDNSDDINEKFFDHNGDVIDLDEETGNEDFSRDEEKFWHTDPNSNDTANRGNPDEANVAGLGITSFTWNYQKGDEVGVAVEGISTEPSPTNDSSYKTMWAMNEADYDFDVDFTNNDYPKTTRNTLSTTVNVDDPTTTTLIIEETVQEIDGGEESIVNGIATIKQTVTLHEVVVNSSDHTIIISDDIVEETIEGEAEDVFNPIITYFTEDFSNDFEIDDSEIEKPSDLNEFLYDSLVSPQENSAGSNKLDINLSYSPNNPINDPTGIDGDGDLLTVHASVSNAKDTNYLQYDWKVYAGTDISSDTWTQLLKPDLPGSTQSIGLGIDTFKFKLGLDKENKYLKIVLTVTENVGEKHPRKSTQDVIIPISSTTEKIGAYNVSAIDLTDTPNIDPDNLSRVKFDLGSEVCKDNPMEKALCPVIKNQIIAISVPAENFEGADPDFLWTIDGKPFSYPYCFFNNCDQNKQLNVAYFPILKEVGEQYTVNLIATNKYGDKINISRNFQVVEPEITILSSNTQTCDQVVLGNYFDVNGTPFPDYSRLNFWANNDSPIKLKASTTGFSVLPENLSWEIDNNSIDSANASLYGFDIDSTGILTLPAKEKQGESYSISVGTLYTQNNLIKKALSAIWGVTYNQFYEKIVSDDAIITMQDAPTTTASKKSKKIFATIYSSTPAYLAFLLRIVLTISLILFVTKLIFSFSPETISREE